MKQRLWLLALISLPVLTLLASPVWVSKFTKPDRALVGEWTAPVDVGVVGIHAALVRTGKVLLYFYPVTPEVQSPAILYDPVSGAVTDVTPEYARDIYCSGISNMPDGRVLAAGGQEGSKPGPGAGIKEVSIFDPITETWLDGTAMNYARWYPTTVQMPDGDTLAVAGMSEDAVTLQRPMERYNPTTHVWTALPPSANVPPRTDLYPRMVLLKNGKVMRAGTGQTTYLFDPAANTWSFFANMQFGTRLRGAEVLLPGMTRVLTSGGSLTASGDATNTAEILDLAGRSWSYVAPMNFPRKNHNLVLLPDGTVLAVGGGRTGKYGQPIKPAELYDPNTGQWTVLAAQAAQRTYHSTALLLPDGRVFSAGSDNGPLASTVEIFSPPYLFKGPRPVLSSVPGSLGYRQPFTIGTADAASITRVAMIRLGTATHANDSEQRYVDLAFTAGSGELSVTAPASGNIAPPGFYMLVIINSNGVPSVMPIVQLQ